MNAITKAVNREEWRSIAWGCLRMEWKSRYTWRVTTKMGTETRPCLPTYYISYATSHIESKTECWMSLLSISYIGSMLHVLILFYFFLSYNWPVRYVSLRSRKVAVLHMTVIRDCQLFKYEDISGNYWRTSHWGKKYRKISLSRMFRLLLFQKFERIFFFSISKTYIKLTFKCRKLFNFKNFYGNLIEKVKVTLPDKQ